MYKGHVITAVVPAYNEQKLIAKTIATMPDLVDRIIVVDDKSTDSTVAMAESVGDPRVVIVRHEENTGVGGAILTGHRSALAIGGDIDVVMAGDAQMDPDYLPSLLDPIVEEGYGFTKANRFFSRDSFRGMPAYRIAGNLVLSLLMKVASGYWHLFDPQNGYTAIRHDVLRRLALDRIAVGYHFENDLLINLAILRVRARDVPIPAVYGDEVSAMRLSQVIPQIGGLLFVGFWKRILHTYVLGRSRRSPSSGYLADRNRYLAYRRGRPGSPRHGPGVPGSGALPAGRGGAPEGRTGANGQASSSHTTRSGNFRA